MPSFFDSKVKINFAGLQLPLHNATLCYVGQLPSEAEWQIRGGRSGHDHVSKFTAEEVELMRQRSVDYLCSESGKKALNDFVKEASLVLRNLVEFKTDFLKEYLGEKKFLFILGVERSGGTYLFDELHKLYGINQKQINLAMTHDSLPEYRHLINWQNPRHWIPLLFEFAQFLTWVRRELSDVPMVIHKHAAHAHAFRLLESLFKGRAEYLITVRHPGAVLDSMIKTWVINLKDENPAMPHWIELAVRQQQKITAPVWQSFSYGEKILAYWRSIYENVALQKPLLGQINVLNYGTSYPLFLQERARELSRSDWQPSQLNVQPKIPQPYWPSQEKIHKASYSIQNLWKARGLNWPELGMC